MTKFCDECGFRLAESTTKLFHFPMNGFKKFLVDILGFKIYSCIPVIGYKKIQVCRTCLLEFNHGLVPTYHPKYGLSYVDLDLIMLEASNRSTTANWEIIQEIRDNTEINEEQKKIGILMIDYIEYNCQPPDYRIYPKIDKTKHQGRSSGLVLRWIRDDFEYEPILLLKILPDGRIIKHSKLIDGWMKLSYQSAFAFVHKYSEGKVNDS